MIRNKFLSLVIVLLLATYAGEAYAQPGPPPWAPAHGYRAKSHYTYFPSLNFYFDNKAGVYFFFENSIWVRKTALPSKYKSYNWSKYKFEEFEWTNAQPWEKHHGKTMKKSSKSKTNNGKSNGKSNGKGKS